MNRLKPDLSNLKQNMEEFEIPYRIDYNYQNSCASLRGLRSRQSRTTTLFYMHTNNPKGVEYE
ncbi:MAG: hypothetical protein IID16_02555 [Candidatus Marinimicrobia bacterium]|nr:hypothetical protein [Candidatus Neomarinimicrobiota bacterium]